MFDQEGKGYITGEDLQNKFVEMNLEADAGKILSRFDRDRDGQLSFSEFSKLITPIGLEYQNNNRSRSSYGSSFGSPQKLSLAQT